MASPRPILIPIARGLDLPGWPGGSGGGQVPGNFFARVLLWTVKQDASSSGVTDTDLHELEELASVDRRTAMRWLLGLPTRPKATARMERAWAELNARGRS